MRQTNDVWLIGQTFATSNGLDFGGGGVGNLGLQFFCDSLHNGYKILQTFVCEKLWLQYKNIFWVTYNMATVQSCFPTKTCDMDQDILQRRRTNLRFSEHQIRLKSKVKFEFEKTINFE